MRANGTCLGCSGENKLTSLCKLYPCFEAKGLDTCLQCGDRLKCKKYSTALKHCPIRRSMVGHW